MLVLRPGTLKGHLMPPEWENIIYFRRSLREVSNFLQFFACIAPFALACMLLPLRLFPWPSSDVSDSAAIHLVILLIAYWAVSGFIGALIGMIIWKKVLIPRYLVGFRERHGPITFLYASEVSYLYGELSRHGYVYFFFCACLCMMGVAVFFPYLFPLVFGMEYSYVIFGVTMLVMGACTFLAARLIVKFYAAQYTWRDANQHLLPEIRPDPKDGCC